MSYTDPNGLKEFRLDWFDVCWIQSAEISPVLQLDCMLEESVLVQRNLREASKRGRKYLHNRAWNEQYNRNMFTLRPSTQGRPTEVGGLARHNV